MTGRLPDAMPVAVADLVTAEVWDHLTAEYRGVFDERRMVDHIADHVGDGAATDLVERVRRRCPDARSLVDIGSGYGSFVATCAGLGIAAIGVDLAPMELRYAAARRGHRFVRADGTTLPLPDAAVDVVTMWHVLEHVDDVEGVLDEALRILRPGGSLFVIAPNYDAFRIEPHYHVPWAPGLRGRPAEWWLRRLGRDPKFWREQVRPCSARTIHRLLARRGSEVHDLATDKLTAPEAIRGRRARAVVRVLTRLGLSGLVAGWIARLGATPLRGSIQLEVRKP